MIDPTVLAARSRVVASKAHLDASLAQARARLSPRSLAANAVASANDKAIVAAQNGMEVVRHRPLVAALMLSAVGLVLARKPVFGLIGSLFRRRDATAANDASLETHAGAEPQNKGYDDG